MVPFLLWRLTVKNTFVFSVMLSLFLAAVVCCGEGQDDAKAMEGTWLPTTAEVAGKKLPDKTLKTIKLALKGDSYTVTVGEQTDRGKVKLDPGKKPRAMDITGTEGPNKGKTMLAIYELTKDSLKICYDLSGQARPTKFKPQPGPQLFLVTYKRQ